MVTSMGSTLRGHRRRALGAAAAASLALLCGCASPPMLPALEPSEAPQFNFPALAAEGQVPIANLAIAEGATVGGRVGLVGGALWGLACGPFAMLCIPLTAGAGLLAGSGAGATVGVVLSLPQEKAERLRSRIDQARAAHDLTSELREQVLRRARAHWDLQAGPATAVVSVQWSNLALTATRDEQIGLIMEARVIAQRQPAPAGVMPIDKRFACTPAPAALALWLDERNDFIDLTFSACAQQIAAQIVGEIARR